MTKRSFNLRSLKGVAIAICLAGITVFSGCDKGDKNDPNKDGAITVADNSSLTQEVFADNISGKSLTSFTTTGAWTSSITEATSSTKSTMLKSGNKPDWISITPDHGDKAGTYNIEIILEPNTTGADRTSDITITCNGENIKITVTQKGVKEDGKELTVKDLLTAHPWKSVVKIREDDRGVREDYSVYIFTFKVDGSGTSTEGYSFNYSISGNKIIFEGGEGAYTISKLTDSELILTLTGSDGYKETLKFIKP